MKSSMLKCVFMLAQCECMYAHMFMYVSVGVSMVVVGDVFQSLLSVSHCSGKLFAILHD